MKNKKMDRAVADILFGAQLLLAVFFCGSEFLHLWNEGVSSDASIVMFVCVEAFALLGLTLAWSAYAGGKSRKTLQTLLIYVAWAVGWTPSFLMAVVALVLQPTDLWTASESFTLLAVIAGVGIVARTARIHRLSVTDAGVKGGTALTLKAVPQVGQAVKFYLFGGASWGAGAVFTGHVTIVIRIVQIWMTINELKGQERERKALRELRWLLIAEVGNELSWLFATVFWLVWFFGSG